MRHPLCEHQCTSKCRQSGCNCLCGEYCNQLTKEEYKELLTELNAELLGDAEEAIGY